MADYDFVFLLPEGGSYISTTGSTVTKDRLSNPGLGYSTPTPCGIGTFQGDIEIEACGSFIGRLTCDGDIKTFSNLDVSGITTIGPLYEEVNGKIGGPGNGLNIPSNSSITIDFSQSTVAIGTVGREPIWNFTNVPLTTSKMASVTVIGISSIGSPVSMGRTYTVNGGPNKAIAWATTSVPNFDTSNWNILTFRYINDSVGVSSVFAIKE